MYGKSEQVLLVPTVCLKFAGSNWGEQLGHRLVIGKAKCKITLYSTRMGFPSSTCTTDVKQGSILQYLTYIYCGYYSAAVTGCCSHTPVLSAAPLASAHKKKKNKGKNGMEPLENDHFSSASPSQSVILEDLPSKAPHACCVPCRLGCSYVHDWSLCLSTVIRLQRYVRLSIASAMITSIVE